MTKAQKLEDKVKRRNEKDKRDVKRRSQQEGNEKYRTEIGTKRK